MKALKEYVTPEGVEFLNGRFAGDAAVGVLSVIQAALQYPTLNIQALVEVMRMRGFITSAPCVPPDSPGEAA